MFSGVFVRFRSPRRFFIGIRWNPEIATTGIPTFSGICAFSEQNVSHIRTFWT